MRKEMRAYLFELGGNLIKHFFVDMWCVYVCVCVCAMYVLVNVHEISSSLVSIKTKQEV